MPLRCEEFSKNILPIIKREISMILYKNYNLSQEEIARKIYVTQAAVSQYIKGVRGRKKIELSKEEIELINNLARELYINKNSYIDHYQHILCKICELRYKNLKCSIKVID
ncbi:MAG: transcriptional regulator [Nanopusillaceae archaeon]